MAAPIQKLTRLASRTFAKLTATEGIQTDKIAHLRSVFNEITAADVNFDPRKIRQRDMLSSNRAPVSYIHLWEDDHFSMGIFIVKNGCRLPLHDHPGMYGLIKVIHGTMKIQSFSEVKDVEVPKDIGHRVRRWQLPLLKSVCLENETSVTVNQECCQLTPNSGNFHEITALSEMAAFVDILAPPYDQTGNRDCHYYSHVCDGADNIKWIMRVPQPNDFWCDSFDYTGPDLDVGTRDI